jgi:hypothetical protein
MEQLQLLQALSLLDAHRDLSRLQLGKLWGAAALFSWITAVLFSPRPLSLLLLLLLWCLVLCWLLRACATVLLLLLRL